MSPETSYSNTPVTEIPQDALLAESMRAGCAEDWARHDACIQQIKALEGSVAPPAM